MKNLQSSGGLKDLSKCGDRSGIACNGMRSNNIRGILRYRRGAETVAYKAMQRSRTDKFSGVFSGNRVVFFFRGLQGHLSQCRKEQNTDSRISAITQS